jgi:hypothetical protein
LESSKEHLHTLRDEENVSYEVLIFFFRTLNILRN